MTFTFNLYEILRLGLDIVPFADDFHMIISKGFSCQGGIEILCDELFSDIISFGIFQILND